MNKNKILSGGGKTLTGGGKWGWRGREVGGEGEGSGVKGGGKWGLGTPLSTPSVSGSGGVPYLKIVNFQSEYRTRVKNLHTRLKIDLYSLIFIKIFKENLLQMVREVTIKINLYAQKRIPSIAIKNSSDTVCTCPTG